MLSMLRIHLLPLPLAVLLLARMMPVVVVVVHQEVKVEAKQGKDKACSHRP